MFQVTECCFISPPLFPPKVTVELCPGERGAPLALKLSTNNEALIVSVVVVDPDGELFHGEVRTFQ